MGYGRFFELYNRLNGTKKIAVLKTDKLQEFISELVADTKLDRHYKIFLLISLSGGLRVTEALSLSKNDFSFQDGDIYVRVNVLKKQKEEERLIKVHPLAVRIVTEWLSGVVGKLFKFSARSTLRWIKELTGLQEICNHSLRHSLISFLLFERNLTHIKAAKLIHIGLDSMMHYSHLNERKVWKEVF